MNSENRVDIILKEIDYWRQNRLLPEHYCDFLQNLYIEQAGTANKNSTFSIQAMKQGNSKVWLLGFLIFSLICGIGFYFSLFPWPLQMATTLLVTSVSYTFAAVKRPRDKRISLFWAFGGNVLLLGLGGWMLQLHQAILPQNVAILILCCGILWWVTGHFLQLEFITYTGLLCFILLYALLLKHLHTDSSWLLLQLYWLPLSGILGWLSWFSHYKIKFMAPVWFAAAITIWFMPELDLRLILQIYPKPFMLWVMVKLALAFVILYVLRKKWMVWISNETVSTTTTN
ncbi:hypothetical protein J2Z69_000200 [Paenibacillus shirakamiensis]|uniref:DUF2157 domain-containing protein n=1 Tax=Paenibacillus shirakamiensis TaxID=1265935 RepID=A0ABS4JE04_9BACL|nr:hypothetical protein [Paenibacillus shirakamiensis]MBP1999181.1 hypothetical protein [Paenibacillus shirakamiensis]